MKNKILILSLLLFSVFLIPSNVFANSIKVQFEDYSLNFTEEERQKAIDSILSNTVLNNYSKDDYYYTILYTASYKNIIINSFKLEEFISLMLKQAFNQLLISSLIVLFVGILFVGLYIIVNKINRRNNGNT